MPTLSGSSPFRTSDWKLAIGPVRVGRVDLSKFEVGGSLLTELHLDVHRGSADATAFVEHLRAEIRQMGKVLVVVEPFNPRATGLLGRLRTPRLADRLARMQGVPREVAVDILGCCGLAPEQKADLIPWTDRMLINFELAARRADAILLHDIGVDGTERPLVDHLRVHLRKGLAVVALEYPRAHGPTYPRS